MDILTTSDDELARIEEAFAQARPEAQVRIIRANTDKLFSQATDQQVADYLPRRAEHTDYLVKLLRDGAGDDVVVAEARKFFGEALKMERTPATPPTPASELKRVAAEMSNLSSNRVPYRGPELEALETLLGPGEAITRWDMRSITTTQKVILRRDLVRANCPSAMTEFRRWDAMFPSPREYEGDDEVATREE